MLLGQENFNLQKLSATLLLITCVVKLSLSHLYFLMFLSATSVCFPVVKSVYFSILSGHDNFSVVIL